MTTIFQSTTTILVALCLRVHPIACTPLRAPQPFSSIAAAPLFSQKPGLTATAANDGFRPAAHPQNATEAVDAQAHFHNGVELLQAGQIAAALDEFSASEAAHEPAPLLQLYRGIAEARGQEWPAATADLKAALARHRNREDGWFWLGVTQLMTRQLPDARTSLLTAVRLNANDGDAYRTLGFVELESGDWNAAYRDWTNAVRVNPRDEQAVYAIGRLFYDARRITVAESWLKRAVSLAPHDFHATYYLGLCEEALGNVDAAIAQYRQSVNDSRAQHKPYSWSYSSLGKLLSKTGRTAEAAEVLEEGVQLAPESRVLTAYGELLFKQHRFIDAEPVLERAIALDTSAAEPHYTLARVLAALGDHANSKREFENFRRLKDAEDAHARAIRVRHP